MMSLSILAAVFVAAFSCANAATRSSADTAAHNQMTAAPADKCTAIAVTRGATVDGSTMTTHSADCFDCDWRVNKVCETL